MALLSLRFARCRTVLLARGVRHRLQQLQHFLRRGGPAALRRASRSSLHDVLLLPLSGTHVCTREVQGFAIHRLFLLAEARSLRASFRLLHRSPSVVCEDSLCGAPAYTRWALHFLACNLCGVVKQTLYFSVYVVVLFVVLFFFEVVRLCTSFEAFYFVSQHFHLFPNKVDMVLYRKKLL